MASYAHSSNFQWQDYLVFSIMLVISSLIGLFFGIKSRLKRTTGTEELLTGSRKLTIFPVAMSLSASFTSATTILGIPAEVYLRGGEQWLWCFGLVPCFLIVAFFILPVIYRLQLTNAYEYLQLRFNRVVRCMGSTAFSIIILVYMAAVLYAPAIALSQVTGISREISVLVMGIVCTFYTSIGGIRAVVWTDAFQLIVVWSGLLALMFKGASDVGGWTKVWDTASEGSRLPRFDMDPNPFVRHTFWTLLIGGCTNMMTVYGANQTNLQRYSSVRSLRDSKIALLLNLPLWILYLTVLCLLGLVMYAFYVDCDPLLMGTVAKRDQLVPLFVQHTMGSYPGLPGLFVASIFSASISTVSSGINSLAAVTLEDLVKPVVLSRMERKLSSRLLTVLTIVLVIIFGSATIGLAYIAGLLGKTALMISFSIFGIVGGPLLGLIMNGIFIPFVNSWGAALGFLASLIACSYAGIDPILHPPPSGYLSLTTNNCPVNVTANATYSTTLPTILMTSTASMVNSSEADIIERSDSSDHLYLSYLHYSTLALAVSAIVAIVVSALTGCNKGKIVDERTYYKYSFFRSAHSPTSYDLSNLGASGKAQHYDNEEPRAVYVNSTDIDKPVANGH